MQMDTRRRWLKAGIVAGTLLTFAPLIGLLGTVVGMARSFQALGENGIGDPHGVAQGVSWALVSSVVGLVVLPFGLVLLVTSAILLRRHHRLPVAPTPLPPPSPPPP